ncbi:hypothetical protein DL93DRAFT_764210 [Clavulina sp. PMI_390]|nr:hypothetical protein DL93DRAFT_764210 [Clavulina sp. PMI_390]
MIPIVVVLVVDLFLFSNSRMSAFTLPLVFDWCLDAFLLRSSYGRTIVVAFFWDHRELRARNNPYSSTFGCEYRLSTSFSVMEPNRIGNFFRRGTRFAGAGFTASRSMVSDEDESGGSSSSSLSQNTWYRIKPIAIIELSTARIS